MNWEIEKFNKEVQDLRRLGQEHAADLSDAQALSLKAKVMQAVSGLTMDKQAPAQNWRIVLFGRKFVRYGAVILVGLSLVGGTAFASYSALPGDVLYPVKRLTEKVELGLAVSQQSKAALQEKFAETRLAELQEISVKTPSVNILPKQKNNYQSLLPTGTSTNNSSSEFLSYSQATTSPQNERSLKLQLQARQDADAAVSGAVKALEQVQSNLKSKGQDKAAASINSNIINLQLKASQEGLFNPENNPALIKSKINNISGQSATTIKGMFNHRQGSGQK